MPPVLQAKLLRVLQDKVVRPVGGSEELRLEPAQGGLRPSLDNLERQYIRRVLAETGGDKQAAAKILGVSVRTLQRKVKEL